MKRFSARPLWQRALSAVLTAVLLVSCTVLPVQAATQAELEQQLAALQQKLEADKAALAGLKQDTAAAKEKKQLLEGQVSTLKSQISVITGSIAEVNGQIGETEQAILDTEADIALRQQELDTQWGSFKQRMAAMQEMRDNGAMGLLSAVSNLYQFLTFNEAIQDVSRKDTEMMDEIQQKLDALAQAKADLEAQKTELQAQQAELEAQQATLKAKQGELAEALVQASDELLSAQEAQAQAQEQLDSDQMDYDAVYGQIQDLIGTAAGGNAELSFTGFICPLKSYRRVSSEYGYRTLKGKRKLHAGTDYAADEDTPIYAAAAGYVCAAGWNSGGYGYYVLIYHGTMNDGKTYSTLYAHMVRPPVVTAGSYVAQGQHIGNVGNTGNSFGDHLHLEVWQGSTAANSVANKAARVDPRGYVPR